MNLFTVAKMQLIREGKNGEDMQEIIKYAIKIRKWLDNPHNRRRIFSVSKRESNAKYYLKRRGLR